MALTYIDPKTKNPVDLSSYGDAGAQNLQANKQGLDVSPTSTTITPASLTPTTPTTFQQPTTPETPVVPPAPTPIPETTAPVLSPAEQQAQDIINQATGANTAIAGKAGYTLEQQTAAGVPEQQKLIRDLNAQLIAAHNEANAIPLKTQAQAEGRGITAGGLAPITAAAQRQNAIKILETNSVLAAAQGNLQNAMDMADRAVAAKYAPMEADLKAKLANLDLIIKSPAYDAATKKRAAEVAAQAQQNVSDLATKKKNEQDRNDLVTKIIGVNPTITTDQITALKAAKDPIEAASVASYLGLAQEKAEKVSLPASAQEYEYAKKSGYTGTYMQYQNEDANRKAVIAKASQQGLPYQVVSQIDKLSSSFDSSPIVKQYNEVQNKKLSVDSIISSGIKGPADLALVFEFMKALDPTSVVRESEYDTASKSGNIFQGAYARFNGYFTSGGGFLPEQVKKDFQTLIDKKYGVASQQYNNLKKETARKINIKTGQPDGVEYLTSYEQGAPVSTGTESSTTAPRLLQPSEIPSGYYQASDGLLYKK